MSNEGKYLEDLAQIRNIMEKSTRFLSLSGLSGIFVGVVALAGASVAQWFYESKKESQAVSKPIGDFYEQQTFHQDLLIGFSIIAASVLFLALMGGYYFTAKKAKKHNQAIWSKTSKDLLVNLFVPLAAGGVFSLGLIYHEAYLFVAPAMLIFYGLSLFGSSKFTFDDIRWLGLSEILLGFVSLFFLGESLLFWSIGFGFLHILYGSLMYFKYDFKK